MSKKYISQILDDEKMTEAGFKALTVSEKAEFLNGLLVRNREDLIDVKKEVSKLQNSYDYKEFHNDFKPDPDTGETSEIKRAKHRSKIQSLKFKAKRLESSIQKVLDEIRRLELQEEEKRTEKLKDTGPIAPAEYAQKVASKSSSKYPAEAIEIYLKTLLANPEENQSEVIRLAQSEDESGELLNPARGVFDNWKKGFLTERNAQ